MAETKSKTTDADTTEEAAPTTELLSNVYEASEFEKRHAALQLALTANAPDPVKTAGEFLTFLAPAPAVEVTE